MSDLKAKADHLRHVVDAVASAPEGAKTDGLTGYLSDNGVSAKELKSMLDRGCCDSGAVFTAISPKTPAKKKAAKKSA
jgi:hypothetical protein